ncbi:uncharacterized protein V1518DRAFT_415740 [Limtongia smithiae]|uniref:uncharacterized protein n=1 Tax=Limtongia smithiae TaxID=1125753 RepID=UPI0034CE9068
MGESAADVMAKLRAMKAAKAQKSAPPPLSLASSRPAKKQKMDAAAAVMEQLRQKKAAAAASAGARKGTYSVQSKRVDGLRIVDLDMEDDSDEEAEDGNGDDDDDRSDDDDDNISDNDDDDIKYSDDDEEEFTGIHDGTETSEQDHAQEDEEEDDGPVVMSFDGSKTQRVSSKASPRLQSVTKVFDDSIAYAIDKQRNRAKDSTTNEQPLSAEAMNLKNDVALQRLITESHILSEANRKEGSYFSSASASFDPIGKARLKTLNARIDSLALQSRAHNKAKKTDYYSLNPQALEDAQKEKFNKLKMPMNMRKGMLHTQAARQTKYEAKAREAGIVLPVKPKATKKSGTSQRKPQDRAPKIQSVGRFTKQGLVVSKSDIARISSKRKRR